MERLKDKRCPRCKGFVITDRDPNGWYEQCIQCGYHRDVEIYELRQLLMTAKKVKGEDG